MSRIIHLLLSAPVQSRYYSPVLLLLILSGSPAESAGYEESSGYYALESWHELQQQISELRTKVAHQELVLNSQRQLLKQLRNDNTEDPTSNTFVCGLQTLNNKTSAILQDTFTVASGFTGIFGPAAEIRRNYIEVFKNGQHLRHSHFGWATLSMAGSTLFLVHVAINPEESTKKKEINAIPSSTNVFMQGSIISLLFAFRLASAWKNRPTSP